MSDVEDLQAFLQQQKVPDTYGLPELKAGNLRIQGPPVEGQYSQAEADKQAQDYPEETYAHHVGLPDIQGPDTGMPVPTKPGMQFETPPETTDDLQAFLDSRKDQDTAAIRQRATGILNQYRTDPNFHLPPEWYDSLVREATAGTTPTGQVVAAAQGIGEAFLPVPFSKEVTGARIPIPVPTWETAKATAGVIGSGLKTAAQFIGELGDPNVPRTVIRGAAAHGTASGMLGMDALVASAGHAIASQFQDPEERIQALKELWQQDHENAATVQNLDKIMGYTEGAAPGTESAFEFGAAAAPFAAIPEMGIGKAIPNVAGKLVEDVIPGVVGGAGRVAPGALSAAGKTAMFGAQFVPGVGKAVKITKGLVGLLEKVAPDASSFGEAAVKTPVFKFGDFVKGLTEAPEGMNVFEPMQQGVKEEIARLNKSFDLQAKAAGDKVNLNSVRSVEPNGKFTVDAEHLNPAEQKLRTIQQQLTDQRAKFNTLEQYSNIMSLSKDAAKLGIGTGLTAGAGGVTMGGIAALQAMPEDVERSAMEGVPTGMALTTPALLPEAIKTMQVSRSGRIKAAGDYQAYKGSQVPTHPDAAPLSTQGQRAVNIVNGSIWEGGGQAVPVTREKMADLTKSTPDTAPMGYYDPDTMTAYLRQDAVERYGQNGPVGHEFTHALDQLTGDTATKAYGTILDGVKSPEVGFRLKDFLYNYMSALRKSDPTAKTLSMDSLMSEGAAELARYILAKTPLEELMSGKTYQKVISDKIGDAIAAINGTSGEVFTAPGFGTPFTREQYRAMENAIYDWGKQVRRGDVTRPEVPGVTPAVPTDVVIPKEVSKLNVDGRWNIPDEFLKQAVQRAAPNAAPADILIDALKAAKEGAKAAAAPAEPVEGKPPVNEWEAEADRKVKEFVAQGIPEEQAVLQAAEAMKDWEQNRPPAGQGLEGRLMPEIAPQTEEFKRWSGEAPVVLNAGLTIPSRDQLGLRMENAVGGGYNITDGKGNILEGPIQHIELASDTMHNMHMKLEQQKLSQDNAGKFQTGQPVVVGAYHGTPSDQFHVFDTSKLGSYTGAPSAKEGFFFSGSPETAATYKERLPYQFKGYKDMATEQKVKFNIEIYQAMMERYHGPEGIWRMEPHWAKEGVQNVEKWAITAQNGTRMESNLDQATAEKMISEHNAALPNMSNTLEFAMSSPELTKNIGEKITGKPFDMSQAPQGHLHEVYVKMQNPFVYDFKGDSYREQSYYNLIRKAKDAGHDGAIFTNTYDGGGKPDNIFVAFDNKNIKSTENMGTFDPSNPDIRYMPDVGDFQKLAKDAGYEFQGDLDGVLFWKNPDTGHEITAEPWRGRANAIADFKDKLSGKYVPGQDVYRTSKQDLYGQYGERSRLKREGEGDIRYMPNPHPDAIKEAAIKLDDGTIYSGLTHGEANSKIYQDGREKELPKSQEGFIDKKRNFLTREQAYDRAVKIGQASRRGLSQANQDLWGYGAPPITGKSMDALQFDVARQFMPEVNIGMHVGGEEKLTAKDIAGALQATGVKVLKLSEQRKEGMEPTVVATLSRALTAKEGDAVSKALGQEAIAQHQVGGQGDLFGPQAKKWGPFNPEYFVTHDGKPLTEALKDRLPTRTGASGIWDRMTVDPNFMQGEFEKAAEATGANPKERFYRQTPAAQKAITDYFKNKNQAAYMPSPHPDAIKSAAVRNDDTGKIYTGPLHWQAEQKMLDESSPNKYTHGYVTKQGKFLNRDQASEHARSIGQITDEGYRDAVSERTGIEPEELPDRMSLDAGAFRDARQFMPSPHPDAITESAYKTKDGKIFTGPIHTMAEDKAMAAGYHEDLTTGYVTKTGRFLTPDEAYEHARKINQEEWIEPQFMPQPNNPEAISAAAVRTKDGRIFTGAYHATALDRLRKAKASFDGSVQGFVNNKGEFLDRDQAFDLGVRNGQISSRIPEKTAFMEDVRGPGTFNRGQFMPSPHPEAITEAAVRTKDGTIFRAGPWGIHSDAADAAFRSGHGSLGLTDGFVTRDGRFLNRKQALIHADKIKQIPTGELELQKQAAAKWGEDIGLETNSLREGQQFFMPSPHPDAIKEAAIKLPDGRIFSGTFHGDAEQAALDSGLHPYELNDVQEGFIDNSGRFWDRKQAAEIGMEHGQIPKGEASYNVDAAAFATPEQIRKEMFMPDVPSDQRLKDALSEDKASKIGAHRDLPKGTPVSLRIDIPAYNKTGDYAVTVHDRNIGKVHGYDGIAAVDNPTFYVQEKGAQKVREGMAKYPMAAINGSFDPARTFPKDIGDYTMVGFNPTKHSYFYEKGTNNPVIGGDKAISSGNTVFVKNPVYGNPEGFLYMPDNPMAIDRAALKNKETGEVITGGPNDTHYMIPASSGKADDYLGPNGHKLYEEGFVNGKGYWYDREQAHNQMKAMGQLPPEYQGEYGNEANVTDLRKGRQAQMMPEPKEGYIGHITDEGDIEGEPFYRGSADHESRGYDGLQWRYNPETKTAYWWQHPDEANKDALRDYLDRKGNFPVERNVILSSEMLGKERFAKELDASHLYMPSTPEDALAQTAKEAADHPEAKPLRWKLDKSGQPAMVYDKKTKKTTAKPLEEGYNLAKQMLAERAAEGLTGEDAYNAKIKVAKDKLKEFYDEAKGNPDAMQAKGWYREMKDKLLDKLGGNTKDLILFTRLLATTSPNTNPGINFGFALDAWNRFQKGEYKDIIDKYNSALSDFYQGKLKHSNGDTVTGLKQFAGYLYGHDIIPYASGFHETAGQGHKIGDPKKLGMHSLRVLDTISDHYDRINGLKINQFAHNLAQTDMKATIDLWAARTIHRLLNDGNPEPWRILPMNEKGISPADFKFGQDAFGQAAKELKMSPDDLQAILWFAEKIHYDKQGWSKYLDKGDFRPLVERMVPDKAPKTFRLSDVQPP